MTATIEEARERADRAPGTRFSAFIYDRMLWWAERSGMARRRGGIVGSAQGRVLELGAGTGLNLRHYPEGLDRLVLTEPEKNMARRLERRVERMGRRAEVVRAPAEALPFDDDSFDTVVATLVLCTVEEPESAIHEIRRVLRPGGTFLFSEHVRSDDPRLARRQDRWHGAWKAFGDGCNCNRPTLDLLHAAGFETRGVEHANWRRMPFLVRPLVTGRAIPA
jgi:SAM-dependent methyltransferase